MRKFIFTSILLIACSCQTLQKPPAANLSMPALFGDGMVLQQGRPVPVWGKAAPGTRVRIAVAGRHAKTLANEKGLWQAYVEPLHAGGPYELTVSAGQTKKVIHDVLVGEVWLCSGQSNMEMTMQPGPRAVQNVEQELAAANNPSIRLFTVPRATKFDPQDDCPGGAWRACTPETVKPFSAVGYFFGRDLHNALDVPIGLIDSSKGASPAEAWTSRDALERMTEWRPVMDLLPKLIANSAKQAADYKTNYNKWFVDLDSFDLGYTDGKPVWAGPDFDTNGWVSMPTPGYWEDHGYPNLDGFAWYRKDVEVPAAWAGKPLRLHLTGINDMDRTWFNGTMVGQFEGTAGFSNPRDYPVPANLVHAGRNTIAVRAYDMGNNGGFMGAVSDMHLDLDGGTPTDTVPIAGEWKFKPGMDVATAPQKPVPPVYVEGNQRIPCVLYNAMIAPLAPYGLRGVIWYQGEGNVGRARQYQTLFPALINDWRTVFRQGDLPFYFVQIASFRERAPDANAPSDMAELREAQALTTTAPNTGMAVTIDIGDANNIHPRNKQDVGKRLGLLALKNVYGKNVVADGPGPTNVSASGTSVHIAFDHVDGGLRTSDGAPPRGFAVAGDDRVFHWADTHIENDAIVLSCPDVSTPRAVRYAWADNPDCNLCNGAGLPAPPFRADIKQK